MTFHINTGGPKKHEVTRRWKVRWCLACRRRRWWVTRSFVQEWYGLIMWAECGTCGNQAEPFGRCLTFEVER